MKPAILLVDDEEDIQFGVAGFLSQKGFSVKGAVSLAEAREALSSRRYDATLVDLKLPDGDGLDLVPEIREASPEMGIVVITGHGDIPLAVEAMRRGADDFLTKPVNMADLEVFLKKTLELGTLRRGRSTQERLARRDEPHLGQSAAMREVVRLASLAAENESPVLIQGETGTGKGMLADWIHQHSGRGTGPFVEVDCSGLRGELLASELFGHAKGSFTSAVQDHRGLVEVADGGTLFLDEIGDMDLGVQARVLKVIEEKHYRRVGESQLRTSDFRVLCATNRALQHDAQAGRFRQDLFFRINVLRIRLPAVREMLDDLPGLVDHLLGVLGSPNSQVPSDAMELLEAYRWPGNIRELKNVLERAVLLAGGAPLSIEEFPGLDWEEPGALAGEEPWDLSELERDRILQALEHFGGDKSKAARALGISARTLYRRLRQLEETE